MNTKVLVAIGAIIILGGIIFFLPHNKDANESAMAEQQNEAMMVQDKMTDPKMENESLKTEDSLMMNNEEGEMVKGGYEDYSESKLTFAEKGKVVLFFKANWCPTCIALDKDIVSNLSQIPDNVLILKVDYDNSSDLKKKYQVLHQHTLVQVDASGNKITTWTGSPKLKDILNEIQ